jgi:hypothetical protein
VKYPSGLGVVQTCRWCAAARAKLASMAGADAIRCSVALRKISASYTREKELVAMGAIVPPFRREHPRGRILAQTCFELGRRTGGCTPSPLPLTPPKPCRARNTQGADAELHCWAGRKFDDIAETPAGIQIAASPSPNAVARPSRAHTATQAQTMASSVSS